jgi:hypothetical protein
MEPVKKTTDHPLEDAVSRALRDNLASLQRTAEELQDAFADLVAACASSRPANALPAMMRARAASGALSARLEILSNFVTAALQPREEPGGETVLLRALEAQEPGTAPEQPAPQIPTPMAGTGQAASTMEAEATSQTTASIEIANEPVGEEAAPVARESEWAEAAAEAREGNPAALVEESPLEEPAIEEERIFDVSRLPMEEQELHRRANRLAKVAMQDIQMLRPEAVRAGREQKDLCARLRGDLDKARKEYDRRFKAIFDHPVDYFHYWMVEILAGGDAEALGEYPYPSPVLRR